MRPKVPAVKDEEVDGLLRLKGSRQMIKSGCSRKTRVSAATGGQRRGQGGVTVTNVGTRRARGHAVL